MSAFQVPITPGTMHTKTQSAGGCKHCSRWSFSPGHYKTIQHATSKSRRTLPSTRSPGILAVAVKPTLAVPLALTITLRLLHRELVRVSRRLPPIVQRRLNASAAGTASVPVPAPFPLPLPLAVTVSVFASVPLPTGLTIPLPLAVSITISVAIPLPLPVTVAAVVPLPVTGVLRAGRCRRRQLLATAARLLLRLRLSLVLKGRVLLVPLWHVVVVLRLGLLRRVRCVQWVLRGCALLASSVRLVADVRRHMLWLWRELLLLVMLWWRPQGVCRRLRLQGRES